MDDEGVARRVAQDGAAFVRAILGGAFDLGTGSGEFRHNTIDIVDLERGAPERLLVERERRVQGLDRIEQRLELLDGHGIASRCIVWREA